MRKSNISVLVLLISFLIYNSSCKSSKNEADKSFSMDNQIDSVSYGLGVTIGENIKNQGLDSLNKEAFTEALNDVYKENEYKISKNEVGKYLNNYFRDLHKKKELSNKKQGKKFLEENKKKEGVKVTESGLQYKILEEGSGPSPEKTDTVKVHYHGTLVDGDVFDSSIDRGKPATFQVNRVIKGWQEALTMMKEGGKWKVFIPYNLAYGKKGSKGKIGPYETLIFEIQLLEIK